MCKRSLFGLAREHRDMTFEEFKLVLSRLEDCLIGISFWNYGEPLMNNDLSMMIQYASDQGITTVASTNGLLLDERLSEDLVRAGLKYLIVCIDGTTQNVYEKFRRGGSLEVVKENIRGLVKAKESQRSKFPIIDLQFIVMKDNEQQVADFFSLARELHADVATLKKFSTLMHYNEKERFLPKREALFTVLSHCVKMRHEDYFVSLHGGRRSLIPTARSFPAVATFFPDTFSAMRLRKTYTIFGQVGSMGISGRGLRPLWISWIFAKSALVEAVKRENM
ncbi:MAG: radical SAM protein [Candidatus Omnitrophica bacterium]|nr:radical SAM protein [Candidatus Omnitrophota bacterium]